MLKCRQKDFLKMIRNLDGAKLSYLIAMASHGRWMAPFLGIVAAYAMWQLQLSEKEKLKVEELVASIPDVPVLKEARKGKERKRKVKPFGKEGTEEDDDRSILQRTGTAKKEGSRVQATLAAWLLICMFPFSLSKVGFFDI